MPVQFQINNQGNKILVWYLTESEDELRSNIQINENEVIKLSKISNVLIRKSFLAVRIMIKNLGISEIKYLKNGKPMIDGGFISISHSGQWVGIQFSEMKEVGIDIEKINSKILKIKNRFLSDNELLNICEDKIEKMILCWSAKEAVFKKHGGETVFFKEKIEIININEITRSIDVKINLENKSILETLSYFYPDIDYVLVNTN